MDIVLNMFFDLAWYGLGLIGCILIYTFEAHEQRFVENPDIGELILALAISLFGPLLFFPSLLLIMIGASKGKPYSLIIPYMKRNEYLFLPDAGVRAHLRPELRKEARGRPLP